MELKMMAMTFYENVDPRRKQERVNARMVSEDHAAMSNLSQAPVYKTFDADRYTERLAQYDQSDR